MKNLFDLCKPRESVFSETKREDVLNLSDLVENRINPQEFFTENYITQGMNILFETAFKRFKRQSSTGVIKLTQAMGGGKTHNMLSLGLLAMHPEYRQSVLGDSFKGDYLGKIKVVAFTGRESDAPLGIWGSIAEQLGKKEQLKDYYSPLAAPGENAWIKLLQGEPLLIMLDELPPYLENAKAKTIGNTDLSVVTTTALSNLFSALGKEQLSNVCLVISDLKATYESGSELIQSTFKELENEVNRSALNVEPVGSASDEVYYILKKRLFKELPDEKQITNVALGFKSAINEAKQMGLTSISPDHTFVGIKDSYPFHPSIKDLYARFKENPGFQQTRGLIRLMRNIVRQFYTGENCKAKSKYLVGVFDFDLNDRVMLTTVTQIKQSLTNAIAHDIASNGKSIAEELDSIYGGTLVQDVSKLILVSSLADVPHALLGLSMSETIGFLCEPNKNISNIKKALGDLQLRAWYLDQDKDGRLFFKNTKNLIAEMHSLIDSYSNEQAKQDLKKFLKEKFSPLRNDCYQSIQVFPAIDEINVTADKVTLVLYEPNTKGGQLHPELQKFYDNISYKNRVMFLSGQKDTMNRLYTGIKELKAIDSIISDMESERISENNQQYQIALDTRDKKTLAVLQASIETFVTLYYPSKRGILSTDFLMEFTGNNYNGEDQVKKTLIRKQKFTEEITGDKFRNKSEDRLFTQKEMRWSDVKERAATNTTWQWHLPRALDALKEDCLKKDIWREHGDYIEKGPFEKEKTSVIVQTIDRNDETGIVTLKIIPQYGDKVYYEVGGTATEASLEVEKLNDFTTNELKLSFLCVDSSGEHGTGEPINWTNGVKVLYKIQDTAEGKLVRFQSHPDVKIKYTTDGSNPKEYGGVYENEFILPQSANYLQFVAEFEGEYFDNQSIKVEKKKEFDTEIDKIKRIKLNKRFKTNDTNETYSDLTLLKKYSAKVSDVHLTIFNTIDNGWLDLSIDENTQIEIEKFETTIDNLRNSLMSQGKLTVNLEYSVIHFNSGQDFLDWAKDKNISLSEFNEQEIRQ
ncbi:MULTISPECIES: DUF499 domain-containing protein [Bacillus]|uniref:DUF499 domain-containing protein n=1 Tax=Bacillus TaxID=1386 RepID=UPI001C7F74F6|nr:MULTISPECIES: DUF499 domain-containing protein [Bacillus]BCC61104.1 hypothetical protein BCJMU10_4412 [Bacillus cereus]